MANANESIPFLGNSGEIPAIGSPAPCAVEADALLRHVKREMMDDLDAGSDYSRPSSAKMPRLEGRVCLLKLLIPKNVAGCIIGIGGDVMLRLKNLTKANVKMGKADQLYPSTNDRVCALSGTPDAVLQAVRFIVTKLTVRFNSTMRGHSEPLAPEEDFLRDETIVTKVTFVVMDSTAILLISEKGNTLHACNGDDFGMSISPKKFPVGVVEERLIHCRGPFYRVMEMVKFIVQAVMVDPESANFRNVVYKSEPSACIDLTVPAARNVSSMDGIRNRRAASSVTPAPKINTSMNGVQLLFSPLHGIKNIVSSDMLEDMRMMMEGNGADFRTTTQALGAIASLSSKGMLALSYGNPYRGAGSSTVGSFDARINKNGYHGGYGSSVQPKQELDSFPLGLNSRSNGYGAGPSTAYSRGQQQQRPGRVEIGLNEHKFGHFNRKQM